MKNKLAKEDYFGIFVISGIIGFIYEELFYKLDLGHFVKRGITFGPWIPIYAFGGIFIILLTYKYKDKPLIIFLLSFLVTGILEYTTGFILNNFWNIRLWDYNNEILNFGNVNGYVCLRSVLLFGIAGVFLVKLIVPFLQKFNKSTVYKILSYILFSTFIFDICISLVLKAI